MHRELYRKYRGRIVALADERRSADLSFARPSTPCCKNFKKLPQHSSPPPSISSVTSLPTSSSMRPFALPANIGRTFFLRPSKHSMA